MVIFEETGISKMSVFEVVPKPVLQTSLHMLHFNGLNA